MALMTIYALFGDDIRLLTVTKDNDEIFYAISTTVMSFFLLEIFLMSIVKPGYFGGFYFWLDIVSSISLIFDIGWIWDEATGTEEFSTKNA